MRMQASSSPEPPVIEASRLSVTFSFGGRQQHVIRNLELTVGRGEFTVVMGPSGAGKSTLLYCLSGMMPPTLGNVVVDGQIVSKLRGKALARFRQNSCGFIFQQVHLLDSMSVLDNVLVAGLLSGTSRREVIARSRELLTGVGLDDATQHKFPSMLSGGESQRAACIRAVINRPSVVFADEPTGALNSQAGARVLDLLTEIHRGGQTIVMVTHDVRSALRADRIVYLFDGSVQGEIRLGPWSADDDTRHSRVLAFLHEMGW